MRSLVEAFGADALLPLVARNLDSHGGFLSWRFSVFVTRGFTDFVKYSDSLLSVDGLCGYAVQNDFQDPLCMAICQLFRFHIFRQLKIFTLKYRTIDPIRMKDR